MNEIVPKLARLQKSAFTFGILFLTASGLGAIANPKHFFVSYLGAFVFWCGLTLGCFIVAMIHYLAGGHWGNCTRRIFEAGFMTLPFMAVFFVPIFFGLSYLYPWALPPSVTTEKLWRQKIEYENFTAFLIRAILFFAVWIFIATRLRKWSLQSDHAGDVTAEIKLRTLSGPAIVIVPLTVTFALVDWIMSTELAWFSTIFPLIVLAGQILIAFAFAILWLVWLQPHPPFCAELTDKHFHDLGNLLLAFVMFWTYVAFSQFLIIYSGNQPHETGWYLRRLAGSWKWLVVSIAAFHFFFPFIFLLFRAVKKNPRRLAFVAAGIFLMHAVENFWVIAPTFYPSGISVHWIDFTAWLGLGGIWLGAFTKNLQRQPLIAHGAAKVENSTNRTVHAK